MHSHAQAQAQVQQLSAPRLHAGTEPRIDSSRSVYLNYSFYELPSTPTSATHLLPSGLSQPPLQPPSYAPAHMRGHPHTRLPLAAGRLAGSAAFTVVQGIVMTASVVWYVMYVQYVLLLSKDVRDNANSIVDNAIG